MQSCRSSCYVFPTLLLFRIYATAWMHQQPLQRLYGQPNIFCFHLKPAISVTLSATSSERDGEDTGGSASTLSSQVPEEDNDDTGIALFDVRDHWNPDEFWNRVLSKSGESRDHIQSITEEIVSNALDIVAAEDESSPSNSSTTDDNESDTYPLSRDEDQDATDDNSSTQGSVVSAAIDFFTDSDDSHDSDSELSTHDTKRSKDSQGEHSTTSSEDNGSLISQVVDKFSENANFENLSQRLLSLVARGESPGTDAIDEIVASVREGNQQGATKDSTTMFEIFQMISQYKNDITSIFDTFVGDIDLSGITPTALLYYVEHQDEVKNPSYKRRHHRFYPGVDMSEINRLYDSLALAHAAYADSVQEIQDELELHNRPYELAYANVRSDPGRPAHFVAVERVQPTVSSFFEESVLHAILVVRGTKTVADAVTDLLCDSEDYLGGKAHSLVLESGKYVAEKQFDLLMELCESSGKTKVELTVIGHSLGAGVASIVGMEFNAKNDPRIDTKVVGFGCLAMVSQDLAEQSDFITTVINDDDVIPRLSGATIVNSIFNVLEFDWLPYAKHDVRFAIDEAQTRQPNLFTNDVVDKIWDLVQSMLESNFKPAKADDSMKRLPVEFYPPGKCIHLYRDGIGFSGCYVPNTFFSELHLSRRMIHDHLFVSGYQRTLLDVERERLRDNNWTFEKEG